MSAGPPSPLADRADAATNLVLLFLDQAARYGDDPFLWHKADGAWQSRSWRAVADDVSRLAAALAANGIRRGDRIVLVSENRPEWLIADFAIMAAGAITVPAYTTNTEADHRHILADSGAVAAIVSTVKLAATLLPAVAAVDACRLVVALEPLRVAQASGTRIVDWATLARQPAGRRRGDAGRHHRRARRPRLPDLHQRHRRHAARGPAAPRHDPAERRRRLRDHRAGLPGDRGARQLPVVPAA